jgi:ABC-type uncharacterized transport system ATPase subunit
VILTTHDLGDIEKLCRRVIIIVRQADLLTGHWPDRATFGTHRTIVFTSTPSPATPPETEIVTWWTTDGDAEVRLRGPRPAAAAVMTQIEAGLAVTGQSGLVVRQIYARGRSGEP